MTCTRPKQRGRWIGLIVALVVFALALAGLGGQAASAGEGARASRAVTVSIFDLGYRPATLKVGVGSRVVFANTGKLTHTATRRSFDTGLIKPGKSVAIAFKSRGTFAYHCEIHPSMHGKIVVD